MHEWVRMGTSLLQRALSEGLVALSGPPRFRHNDQIMRRPSAATPGEPKESDAAAEAVADVAGEHVLSEAPIPVAVPTMPCARLKWPLPNAMSATISGIMTLKTAAVMPSNTWTATSK